MDRISTARLQSALMCAAREIVEAEPYLTEVDTVIGDGDHGTGMKAGFSALQKQLSQQAYETPYDLLHASGLCLVRSMGGASGVLFGTLLIGGLDQLKQAKDLSPGEVVEFFAQGIQAIRKRGRAGPGDKTMVDALIPAEEAMRAELQKGGDISAIFKSAHEGALKGVENTKGMLPRAGRSKNFREKAIGHPDPGAISVSILFHGLYEGVQ